MKRLKQIVAVFSVVVILIMGCAQNPLPEADWLDSSAHGKAAVDTVPGVADSWEMLGSHSGEPGVDFDPCELLVVYKANPQPLSIEMKEVEPGVLTCSSASSMPNSVLRQNKHYESITDMIANNLGLRIQQQVYHCDINAASFRFEEGEDGDCVLDLLRRRFDGQIEKAGYSPLHRGALIPNDEDFISGEDGRQWSHWRIGCPEAWDYEMGVESTLIGVVDTGVRLTHEELAGQVLDPEVHFPDYALNLVNNDNSVEDYDGHGTFIAGLAVAIGNNERRITGVAPGCRVIPVKVADSTAAANSFDLIAGCLLAFELGAKVVNVSFSSGMYFHEEEQMVNTIWDGGAVLVSCAANYGDDSDQYPGAYENAVCVGGTDKEDGLWELSNYGLTVNIAAPAMGLKSCTENTDTSYYSNGSGTSYSTAIASGAFGLLFSLGSDVTNAEARQALENSGVLVDGFADSVNRIDVGQAVLNLVESNIAVSSFLNITNEVCGEVVQRPYQFVMSQGNVNVARVTYTLDLAPVGEVNAFDIHVGSDNVVEHFAAQLPIPQDCDNQQARIIAQCYSSFDIPGNTLEQDFVIFNLRGDTDCDGLVNAFDVDFLRTRIGFTDYDPEYSVFADANLDGVIDELDLAWIGYAWDG